MKTTEEFQQGAASGGAVAQNFLDTLKEDQHHDQESGSRMDSEGCPNGGTEDDGRRASGPLQSCGAVFPTSILV